MTAPAYFFTARYAGNNRNVYSPVFGKDEFMFSGVFIVMAGILSLLESFGFISADVKWGVPLAIICFGLRLIYEAFSARKGHVNDKENPSRT